MARRRSADGALFWGGLGLAAVVGAAMFRDRQAAASPASTSPAPLSPYPSIPSAGYKPPVMTSPGYTPPVVGAAPPAPTQPPAAVAPPVIAPPAPVIVGPTASQQNAAFDASMATAHAMQRADFERGAADLAARVAGGLDPASREYRESFDYLANLTGGVATQGQEAAKLTAAGLPPPA